MCLIIIVTEGLVEETATPEFQSPSRGIFDSCLWSIYGDYTTCEKFQSPSRGIFDSCYNPQTGFYFQSGGFNPLQGEYLIHAGGYFIGNFRVVCFNPLQGEYLIHALSGSVWAWRVLVSIPFKGNIWFMQKSFRRKSVLCRDVSIPFKGNIWFMHLNYI